MKQNFKRVNINEIKDPSFLRDMNYDELKLLSSDIKDYIIDSVSKNGGHLSSNLGVIDSTIALCRSFDFTKDKIIFDVGHQCYTYKILTGRKLDTLRQKDGISGFQKRNESIYDHYEAGHSSTSISAAIGMATVRDLNHDNYNIIAFIGDSSIVNGLSFEALNNCVPLTKDKKRKIIIVLNDNDMSISTSVGAFSKLFRKLSVSNFYIRSRHFLKRVCSKTRFTRWIFNVGYGIKNAIKRFLLKLTIFDYFGFSIIGPIDGHDIKQMEKAFEKAKKNDKSTLVIIKTIKGKGYPFSEKDKEGKWHGTSPFNVETGQTYGSKDTSWSKYFSNLLEKKMSQDEKVITITPGTGYGSGLSKLFDIYPNRMIDVGIAEEHAVTLASGISISGYKPVIAIYSTFLQRAYDEIHHDLARMNLNATFLVDRAGLVGNDGDTHQGLYDSSFLNSIPNVSICMPSNTYEANYLFDESFNNHGPYFIRFPKEIITKTIDSYPIYYGKWIKLTNGKKMALISEGPIISKLKEYIMKNNIDVSLYNALYTKPIDIDAIKEISTFEKIVIYDPYSTKNGLSSLISYELLKLNYKGKIVDKSIPDTFISAASIEEQRKTYNVSLDDIISILNN